MQRFPGWATLAEDEVFIVKWQYRILSGFKTALVGAILRADENNLLLLEKGFPMEVAAITSYRWTPEWWQRVQAKALGEAPMAVEGEEK